MFYALDTEFVDDGRTIDLISIGIVSGDGREYYAQDCTFDLETAPPWINEHVIPHLDDRLWKSRERIKCGLVEFLDPEKYGKPEIWGWITSYDWVAFCQLFGTMMDLPDGYPHYMRDIQYLLDERGLSDDQLPPMVGTEHNALADARHIKQLWQFLEKQG